MIANETEYTATRSAADRFERALARVRDRCAQRHPLIQQALKQQLEGEIAALRAQLAEYESRGTFRASG
jgi:hypothetical protein